MAASNRRKTAEERRTEILDVAAKILATEGAAGLSLRAVAGKVGIKLASLQYYFPTFASLVEALVHAMVLRHTEGLQLAENTSGKSPLHDLKSALRWLAVDVPMSLEEAGLEVQFWALAQLNQEAQSALNSYHGAYVALLEKLVLKALPGVSEKDACTRAKLIASLLEGSVLFVTLDSSGKASDADYEDLYETALLIALQPA